MAKLAIKKASTDITTYVFIQDSSKTTGEGLAGLAYNTGSLVGYYVRPKGSATAITLATQTVTGDHSDGGFVEVDATNMPGVYRLDLPDAVCATGVPSVVVMLKGATNMSPVVLEIQLTDFDLNTAAITAAAVADAVWDEATADHTTASSFGALDANVDAILADTGTDGVKLASTQGAILWGQQKIVADVDGQGALVIQNTHDKGLGKLTFGGLVGEYNYGMAMAGVRNQSDEGIGTLNDGYTFGVRNAGISGGMYNKATGVGSAAMFNDAQGTDGIGLKNVGEAQNVEGFDPAIATAADLATLDGKVDTVDGILDDLHDTDIPAIKAETALISEVKTDTAAILADTGTDGVKIASAQTVATVTNLTNLPTMPTDWLTAAGLKADAVTEIQSGLATAAALDAVDNFVDTEVAAILAAVDTEVAAIKAKTDNLPASPAAVGSAMTLTPAYDKAKDDVLTPLGVVDGIVDAIKVQTDKIPASPASAGEYTANIGAIKAKTDNLPLSPASSGEYTSALTAIQNDLDNPNQYKADVSGLATQASVNAIPTTPLLAANYTAPDNASITAIKAKTDLIPATPAQAGEYTSALSAIQADLDNPSQYKADVSGLATSSALATVDTVVDGIATTLANPDNFKADVSALALESTLTAMKGAGWSTETLAAIKSAIDALSSGGVDPAVIAAAILDALLADHTVAGSVAKTIADILEDTGTTLSNLITSIKAKTDLMDASAITYTPNVVGTAITLLRGDTFSATLTDVGALTGYVSIDFTVKRNTSNTDDEAVIRIRKNASGTGDGLLRLNRAAPTTETGEIVIDDEATGDITITLDETATDGLEVGAYLYDVQLITATAVKTLTSGRLNVTSDVTRAIA